MTINNSKTFIENITDYILAHETLFNGIFELVIISIAISVVMYCIQIIFDNENYKKITFKKSLFWLIGSVITFILLSYLNIVNINHQTIVLVAFTWHDLFLNIKDKFIIKKGEDKATKELIDNSSNIFFDTPS